MRFRHKKTGKIINAYQWPGTTPEEAKEFSKKVCIVEHVWFCVFGFTEKPSLIVRCLNSMFDINFDDFVYRSEFGQLIPVTEELFFENYEIVN